MENYTTTNEKESKNLSLWILTHKKTATILVFLITVFAIRAFMRLVASESFEDSLASLIYLFPVVIVALMFLFGKSSKTLRKEADEVRVGIGEKSPERKKATNFVAKTMFISGALFFIMMAINVQVAGSPKRIGGCYGIYDGNVYCQVVESGEIITTYMYSSDYLTFEALGGPYGKDSNQVYYKENVINGADPETFEVTGEKDGVFYAKDINNVYIDEYVLEGEDLPEFSL